ncbi:MAG: alpha/beta fold hydrolase [Actinobacteria bacterium]|nr:alpha/beta fold hydrolase [Actinomycetota bacterium]
MHRPLSIVAVAALALVACSGDDSGSGTRSSDEPAPVARPDTSAAFGWTEFGEEDDSDGTVEIGNLEVPIDHDDPSAGTFDLYVARRLATDPERRIGSLLVNPGGPGYGGTDLAIYAAYNFSDDLLARFDIVGWDPRGTGLTTPAIDCIDDYDRYFADIDITPDDQGERDELVTLADEFETACTEHNAAILGHIGTNDSARDIDAIRAALGEPKITYFGFSYGSELGATWATLFPTTVRAATLDGAVDPNADLETSGLQQAEGFERTFDTFLAHCSEDDDCAFHNDGDAEGAFDHLAAQLDARPVPTQPGRPAANLAVLVTAAGQAMYSTTLWPDLEQALADAQGGDGAGLLALYDMYFERADDGTWPNILEAFQTISCMDQADRPTVAEDDASADERRAVAPRLSPNTSGSYMCTFYPPAPDPRVTITGAGAGPVLVVGTTGDPATPIEGTQAMADALDGGRLLTVVGDEHTGYRINECSTETIDRYLIELELPAEGTRCE